MNRNEQDIKVETNFENISNFVIKKFVDIYEHTQYNSINKYFVLKILKQFNSFIIDNICNLRITREKIFFKTPVFLRFNY